MHSIAPISQFYTDAVNGTLPQVAQIEPASDLGLDEHPEDNDPAPGSTSLLQRCRLERITYRRSSMRSCAVRTNSPPSGTCTPGLKLERLDFSSYIRRARSGFYDHVPPQPTVNPDGILPMDLFSNDPCYGATAAGTICDFSYTGYRLPLVVVSPYAKKNFVSHQIRDTTAIIKLIETTLWRLCAHPAGCGAGGHG